MYRRCCWKTVRPLALRLTIGVFCTGVALVACDLGDTLPVPGPGGDPLPPIPAGAIVLRIENRSGLTAVIDAIYRVGPHEVRRTTRMLAPDGVESLQVVVQTAADALQITARVGPDGRPQPGMLTSPGDILAERTYVLVTDFKDGDVLLFVIPPPGPDCNSNLVPDALDIESGTSADCDANGTPDECQPDRDGDGVIDPCDGCPGDREKTEPGRCGCGRPESGDSDGDGVPDCIDGCPTDPAKSSAGICGCFQPDVPNCGQAPPPPPPMFSDCNTNGVADAADLAAGTSDDCNTNGTPDECDVRSGVSPDCNSNRVPDECDVPPIGRSLRGDAGQLLFPLDGTYSVAPFRFSAPPSFRNDDDSTDAIPLPFTFDLYGDQYTSVFINNNGNISFGTPFSTFSASPFPINGFPMVAPFWADVDTRNLASGLVYFKVIANRTLVVTWDNVGYYSSQVDKVNTFQLAVSNGTDPTIGLGLNAAFSYGDMQWTTGSASGGIGGFGGTPATVGANRGNGLDFFLIGRFDHPGADYDGPFGNPDGVSFLDNQTFRFSTATGTSNIAPIAVGLPPGAPPTFTTQVGQTLDAEVSFLSPESGQITTVMVEDLDNAAARGLMTTTTPGNTARVDLLWSPCTMAPGLYRLRLTAQDDFVPPGTTVVTLRIRVHSRDDDLNGIPDECEGVADCNSNGTPDVCEPARDCDFNGTPDDCEGAADCNSNDTPDPCETLDDCNSNGTPDVCEVLADCDSNGTPDPCEPFPDCNENNTPDVCDIAGGSSDDCNFDGTPDECGGAPPVILRVHGEEGGGMQDGSTWADAFLRLQDALAAADARAAARVEIWVAATYDIYYTPDLGGGQTPGDRTASFRLRSRVAIYGGFLGGETMRSQRNFRDNITVLSGDLAGDDFGGGGGERVLGRVGGRLENSYHVLTAAGVDRTAVLDGFWIFGGNADGTLNGAYSSGGGLFIEDGHPTVANCTFNLNTANDRGGAVYNDPCCPAFVNCVFRFNSARLGGAVYNLTSAPLLVNCAFSGNSASESGGAIYNDRGSNPLITNCTLSGNNAIVSGAGLFTAGPGSAPVVTNCIFWQNVADDSTSELAQIFVASGAVVVNYTDVQGLTGGLGGVGNIGSDPQFAGKGSLQLQPTSPCRDAGSTAALPADAADLDTDGDYCEPTPSDLDLAPRVVGPAVDMGAFEVQAGGLRTRVPYGGS